MSRVTTITLPDDLHRTLVRMGRERGESMAAIIRRAVEREVSATEGQTARPRRRSKTPPRNVVQWLDTPTGAFAHRFRDATVEPADWDADAEDSGVDAD